MRARVSERVTGRVGVLCTLVLRIRDGLLFFLFSALVGEDDLPKPLGSALRRCRRSGVFACALAGAFLVHPPLSLRFPGVGRLHIHAVRRTVYRPRAQEHLKKD